MRAKISGVVGIVGGIVDMVAGLAFLQPAGTMGGAPMTFASSAFTGFFLLTLGVIVLVTGVYLLAVRMIRNNSMIGRLMLLYGAIMLVLGVGMLGELFPMMQGQATLSGVVMLFTGAAMLYSGLSMAKNQRANQ